MKLQITKRDVRFFFLGVLTLFLIDLVWNWDQNWKHFKAGWNSVDNPSKTEIAK